MAADVRSPICVRLPPDLDSAFRARAETEGLSASEMLRSIVSQWIYGEVPSVDEGYLQARTIAAKIAHDAIIRAMSDLPETYEEALQMIRQGPYVHPTR